jgi:putative hydrolase of the HAD superfamily
MRTNSIRAIVFDFDGVILDTEVPEYKAWSHIFKSFGIELSEDEWLPAIGTRWAIDPYQMLKDKIQQLPSKETLLLQKRKIVADILENSEPIDGVLDWIIRAKELGLKLAIASSSSVGWLNTHLIRMKLIDFFDAIVGYDELTLPKPAPDTYLKACRLLGTKPLNAVAIEDSRHGLDAAICAGLKTIVVPRGLTAGINTTGANIVIGSLSELTVENALYYLETGHYLEDLS